MQACTITRGSPVFTPSQNCAKPVHDSWCGLSAAFAPRCEASPLAGPLQLSVGGLLGPVVAHAAGQHAAPLLHHVAVSTLGAAVDARPYESHTTLFIHRPHTHTLELVDNQ